MPQDTDRIAELELRLSQTYTDTARRLFNQVRDPVIGINHAGQANFFNDAAIALWGVLADENIGVPVADLFDSETGSALESLCQQGFEGVGESVLRLKDGRTMSFSVSRQGDEGSYLLLRDISRREILEDELRHARRMASVGRLAAEVAHEINNPLAVIQGRLEMLHAMPDMGSDMRRRHLKIVFDHSHRVARIVQNLQNFASPRPPAPRFINLSEAIAATIELLGRRLERVTIDVDIEPELEIFIDPEQSELIWENLLVSTANIMPASRTMSIRAARYGTNSVRVRVECDAGALPEDVLSELRSPYLGGSFSLDPGRGLALAIAWGIVQDHGGWMNAKNEPEAGASFEAYLPGPSETEDAVHADRLRARKVGWDVLVVDDDVVMAETVGWMLSSIGHRATLVHSAEEALERLEHETFHLILSDHRLPGMDGETMLERVHKQWPDMAGRTVLTSGLLHRPKDGQAYLQKPFSIEQLSALFLRIQ